MIMITFKFLNYLIAELREDLYNNKYNQRSVTCETASNMFFMCNFLMYF